MLPIPITIALVVLLLGVLVVAHEFGHFVTAKRFEVEAPEFGIGLPPRLFTFWRSGGWIQIQGRRISIPAKFRLPDGLAPGDFVRFKTRTEKGREILIGLDRVPEEQAAESMASQVQNLDHGTMYTLNALPIGGFVRMSGEDDPTAPNAFAARPAWQRAIVLVAGVTMNFILAYVAFVVFAMVFPQMVQVATTHVVAVQADLPASKAGLQAGDTIVSVNGVDVRDNRERLLSLIRPNCGSQIVLGIERADPRGALQNLELALTPKPTADLPCALGVQLNVATGQPVGLVAPGSLADQAGIKPGDALVRVGTFDLVAASTSFAPNLPTTDDLASYIQANSLVPTTMPVYVLRDGHTLPPIKIKVPEHVDRQQAALGLTLKPYRTVPEAVTESANQMVQALGLLPRTFSGIANGIANGTDTGVGGPIRIAQAVAEGTPVGGLPFLIYLFGNLSFSLAVLNLLPFPGLDGGRLAFVLLEIVRGGRKVDPRLEGLVHLVGIMVLLAFILFVSYGDLQRLIGAKSAFTP